MSLSHAFQSKVDLSQGYGRARNVHDAFEKLRQLGHGTYGEVYLARDRQTDEQVALKKIKLEANKEKRQGFPITALREMRVLKNLSHRNVVQLKEVCRSNIFETNGFKGSIYLIFEYLDHDLWGLHDRIQKASTSRPAMLLSMAKSLTQQMLQGLAHCHAQSILHRDLKASNLLISRDGVLKLADFGLARPYVSNTGRVGELTYRVCTLWYRSPELLLGSQSYGPEVDIWSAGCILYEMLAGAPLFGGNKEAAMLSRIMDMLGPLQWEACGSIPAAAQLKHFNMLPATTAVDTFRKHCQAQKIPSDAIDLLAQMLSLDPSSRPSSVECLRHAFFQNDPVPMCSEEFLAATSQFTSSHEFVVKNRAGKRSRVDAEQREGSTPDNRFQPGQRHVEAWTSGMHAVPGFGAGTAHAVDTAAHHMLPAQNQRFAAGTYAAAPNSVGGGGGSAIAASYGGHPARQA